MQPFCSYFTLSSCLYLLYTQLYSMHTTVCMRYWHDDVHTHARYIHSNHAHIIHFHSAFTRRLWVYRAILFFFFFPPYKVITAHAFEEFGDFFFPPLASSLRGYCRISICLVIHIHSFLFFKKTFSRSWIVSKVDGIFFFQAINKE